MRGGRQCGGRGVVSVEFAAVAVVLFAMLQIAIETGWQVASELALEHGAHDALRFAITGNSTVSGAATAPACRAATILWLVTHGAPTLLQANNLTVSSSVGSGAAVASSAAGFGGATTQTVTYVFQYHQPYLTPFARLVMSSSFYPHQLSIVAENEPFPTQPC